MKDLSRALSELVVERVGFGIFAVDRDFNLLMWNRFMQDYSGRSLADVVGRNLWTCFPDLPHGWLKRKFDSVFVLGNYAFSSWEQRPFLFKFRHDRPLSGSNGYMQQDCTFMPLVEDGQVVAVCVTLADVTEFSILQREREAALKLVRANADRDGLTGIYNRRYFEERLSVEFDQWLRHGADSRAEANEDGARAVSDESPSATQTLPERAQIADDAPPVPHQRLALLMFDIDHFKRINDENGHLAGDMVLREIAARLPEVLPPSHIFARYGGEEFAVLLPDLGLDEAMVVAEQVRRAISEDPIENGDVRLWTTASLGVSVVRGAFTHYEMLINEADAALYAAKRQGRNQVAALRIGG
ncbi:sensor domain-containing diguanylate cyclase [Pararobbsia silviterrae]|uniref:diguanylate cyclase n=1 Tax=Pararobbsia silviterrae TaxID=1792498 RepID=A0A494WZ02_9BURK|nr:diguanylate cyclase [Pararobbsia silviterrae]RKP43765.1 sensor domain-containing diguanylate cyclase [Pararobbsia silviterrae]